MQRLCALVIGFAFAAGLPVGVAAPIAISGLGGNYSPGGSVSFDVALPPLSNLGSYNIDLLLTSASGVAGTDFFFDLAATIPAASKYVFPSAANYLDAVNVDSNQVQRLTLSDFSFTPVNVEADVNDRVATIAIRTSPTFNGKLGLSIDTAGLLLDTADVAPTPVLGFDKVVGDSINVGGFELLPVPEPSALVMLALGSILASRWIRPASWRQIHGAGNCYEMMDELDQ